MLSASNRLPLIQRSVPRRVPMLIHNHNSSKPVTMQRLLESAGFRVTRLRFDTRERGPTRFSAWLEDVRDNRDPEAQ